MAKYEHVSATKYQQSRIKSSCLHLNWVKVSKGSVFYPERFAPLWYRSNFGLEECLKDFSITWSLHRFNFGPESYFELGPKLYVPTFWKSTKTEFWHVIINFGKQLITWSRVKLQFWSAFKLLKCTLLIQIQSWTLDRKCICYQNTWYWCPSKIFPGQKSCLVLKKIGTVL